MRHASLATLALLAATSTHTTQLAAEELSYRNLVEPVLTATETVVGEALAYPTGGSAKVTAVIVTVPPGGQTGWHRHPAPLFGYILQGELQVDYGASGARTYKAGDGLLEAMQIAHNGQNKGVEPVRILAVYLGMAGLANAEAAPAPGAPPQ